MTDAAPPATEPMRRLRTPAAVGVLAIGVNTLIVVASFVSVVTGGIGIDMSNEPTALDMAGPLAGVLTFVVAAIAVMSWLHRVLTNVRSLPDVRQRFSPGWAVGAWFIPLANLVLPALVVHHAAGASVPAYERRARRAATAVVLAWWLGFVGNLAAAGLTYRDDLGFTAFRILDSLSVALRVTSAVALVTLLVWVTGRQERRFASAAALWQPDTRPAIPTRAPTAANAARAGDGDN